MSKRHAGTKPRPATTTAPQRAIARDPRIAGDRDAVDIASDDSFPASDPPSYTPVIGQREDSRPLRRVRH